MRIDGVEFLARAYSHEGKPYIWGAKGPDAFDCSGLVTFTIKECGGPDWRESHGSALLFDCLDQFHDGDKPTPGCLVFYKRHVMILCPDGRVFGACGGGSSTLTVGDAIKRDAKVRFRSSVTYRPDVLGFRRLPEAAR